MINKEIDSDLLFDENDIPDWKVLKDYMAREGPLTKVQIMRLLTAALQLFSTESNLVQIEEPICVVGDIHG